MPFFFHITPARNLPSILRDGLRPRIGPRSRSAQEPTPGVYLFRGAREAEEATVNWLGDRFRDSEKLALLRVEVDTADVVSTTAAYEAMTCTTVSPEHLHVVTPDIDRFDFRALDASSCSPSAADSTFFSP